MASWKRWWNYGKAKVDDVFRSGEESLAEMEARLEAEAAEKPWLGSTGTPTMDEVRARIEHDAGVADSQREQLGAERAPGVIPEAVGVGRGDSNTDTDMDIDFAEQQRQADARLAAIRSELGLDAATPEPEGPEPAGGSSSEDAEAPPEAPDPTRPDR